MATVIELLPAFEGNLRRRGRTQSTIDLYHRPLEAFATWAADREVNTFQPRDMEAYFDHYEGDFYMRNDRLPASNTRRKVDQAIRNFFEWADRYDYVDKNPMRQIDPPPVFRKTNDWLRPDEDAKLLDSCMTKDEYLAVYLLRFTGLRASGPSPFAGRTWSGQEDSYGCQSASPRLPEASGASPYLGS